MNTPKIRFKGFADDWEQRKVGDQMYIKSRIGWQALTKQEYLSEGDYYLITGTDIDETTHRVDLKRSYYVSKERYEMDSKIQVKEGDIIVTKDGTIGKVAMVTGLDKPATLNSHLFVLRDMSGKLDNHFLLHILNSHMFNHFVKSTKTGSTLTGLPQKTFVEFAFSCPKYEEQKLLSNYFDRLDHLITLHQRKRDETKQLKKFMLQKMFPKNGEKNPEIRFEGFTDDWEQRKVSELFRVTRGYVLAATQTNTTKTDEKPYPVYSSQTKDKGLMGYYKDYLYEDAITWTTDGANAGTVNYRAGKFYCTNVCGVLLSNEVKANQMIAEALNNVAKGYVSYVGNPKLMNNVMADIVIQIPTQAEEREMLSSLFASLDYLITLHQRKCEKLKELKKFMLQNMFV